MRDVRSDADDAVRTGLGRTERKRGLILDAARDLFLEHGFAGTSMDDVAALATVSKQTVYKQFSSKEALFVAIVKGMTNAASDRVQEAMAEPTDMTGVAAALEAHAHKLFEIALTPRLLQLRRLVIAEAGRFPDLGAALYEGGPGRAIAGLATALSRWAKAGLLTVDDPTVAASHFNWLIMGEPTNLAMFYGERALPGMAKRKRHVAAGVHVFLAAYGVSTAR